MKQSAPRFIAQATCEASICLSPCFINSPAFEAISFDKSQSECGGLGGHKIRPYKDGVAGVDVDIEPDGGRVRGRFAAPLRLSGYEYFFAYYVDF